MNGHWKGKLLLENSLSTFYTISLFPNTLTTPQPQRCSNENMTIYPNNT